MKRIRRAAKVHISWCIAIGCFCFVVGVWLSTYLRLDSVVLIGGSGSVVGFCLWWKRVYILPILVIGSLGIGVGYGSISLGKLEVYTPLIGSTVTLSGRVKEDPVLNSKRALVVQLDSIVVDSYQLPGSVYASLLGKPDVLRGDTVRIEGVFTEGFGTFAGVMYTAKLGEVIRPQPGDLGRVVRDWFATAVRTAIPEPQASLGIGYLTGQKSALPDDLSEALQIAGLSHIVVASGYNLTILVRLARRVFMKVSKYVSALSSAIMIICFIAVTGLSPSMTRAGLVSGLSLAAWYYGRRFHPFVLLPFAAGVTVLFQPSYVWGDLGWQLSFSAFAGVMIVAPLLQKLFFGDKEPSVIRQILGETVAAHIVTVPIVVIAFGVLSNVAIPANILIVPLVPLAMLLTFISGVIALVFPMIAAIVGLPATWLLTYMTSVAQYVAELPWAQLKFEMAIWMGCLYYAVLIVACVIAWKVTKHDMRSVNLVE